MLLKSWWQCARIIGNPAWSPRRGSSTGEATGDMLPIPKGKGLLASARRVVPPLRVWPARPAEGFLLHARRRAAPPPPPRGGAGGVPPPVLFGTPPPPAPPSGGGGAGSPPPPLLAPRRMLPGRGGGCAPAPAGSAAAFAQAPVAHQIGDSPV